MGIGGYIMTKYYAAFGIALVICIFLAWKQIHKENIYMQCIHEAHGQGTCAYLIEVVNK